MSGSGRVDILMMTNKKGVAEISDNASEWIEPVRQIPQLSTSSD